MSKTQKYVKEWEKQNKNQNLGMGKRQEKKKSISREFRMWKETTKAPENTRLLLQNPNRKHWDVLYCTSYLLYSRGQADQLGNLSLVSTELLWSHLPFLV